jgi:hypothetical protein
MSMDNWSNEDVAYPSCAGASHETLREDLQNLFQDTSLINLVTVTFEVTVTRFSLLNRRLLRCADLHSMQRSEEHYSQPCEVLMVFVNCISAEVVGSGVKFVVPSETVPETLAERYCSQIC